MSLGYWKKRGFVECSHCSMYRDFVPILVWYFIFFHSNEIAWQSPIDLKQITTYESINSFWAGDERLNTPCLLCMTQYEEHGGSCQY